MKTTDVIIVADLSGSMQGTKEQMLRTLAQDLVKTLADEESKGDQVFNVTFVPFSTTVSVGTTTVASAIRDSHYSSLSTRAAGMGGQTALIDAIGRALELTKPGVVTLISVFSDGEENRSYQYSAARLGVKLKELEAGGNLTLTFAGPESARRMLAQVGIPAGNFRAWDGSEKELTKVASDTRSSYSGYVASRAAGATRSTSFYADTSKLTESGVRGFTKEVVPTDVRQVTKRMDGRAIADFYGSKFQQGHHYYELVKPEYLQDDKDLVIQFLDNNEYRQGSRAVRLLLGLPETGKVRVHPTTPSGKYRLFIQSSSPNRKVVEGQTFITVA